MDRTVAWLVTGWRIGRGGVGTSGDLLLGVRCCIVDGSAGRLDLATVVYRCGCDVNLTAGMRVILPGQQLLRGLCQLLSGLWRSVCAALRTGARNPSRSTRSGDDCCLELTNVHRRPDPLLYSQYYLMSLGLAVTWDNPDIDIFELDPTRPDQIGAVVGAGDMLPDTRYWVRVQVWNGSAEAPVAGLPVELSYLSFGAGVASNPIGMRQISLGVRGSPHSPAHAWFQWTTPNGGGHYCIQALLVWPDDAIPGNNLGQKNIQVAISRSPATFQFEVRNTASNRRRIVFEPDTYELPEVPECPEPGQERAETLLDRSVRQLDVARTRHRRDEWPLPPSWRLTISPDRPSLAPGEVATITIEVEPEWRDGQRSAILNLNAFGVFEQERSHLGGVTLRILNGKVV